MHGIFLITTDINVIVYYCDYILLGLYITTDITVITDYDCITIFTTIKHYYITKLFSVCYYYICNGI